MQVVAASILTLFEKVRLLPSSLYTSPGMLLMAVSSRDREPRLALEVERLLFGLGQLDRLHLQLALGLAQSGIHCRGVQHPTPPRRPVHGKDTVARADQRGDRLQQCDQMSGYQLETFRCRLGKRATRECFYRVVSVAQTGPDRSISLVLQRCARVRRGQVRW